jgi:hypothetical protein
MLIFSLDKVQKKNLNFSRKINPFYFFDLTEFHFLSFFFICSELRKVDICMAKLQVTKLQVTKLQVTKLQVTKLQVTKLQVTKLQVTKLQVTKLQVTKL